MVGLGNRAGTIASRRCCDKLAQFLIAGALICLIVIAATSTSRAAPIVDETVQLRFLPSPSLSVSGYILALRNTHSSSVRIADIGSEFILGDDGVASSLVPVRVKIEADYEMFMVAYNAFNALSLTPNGLRI